MMTPTSKKVVRMLETIPSFETYSKYNIALERVFQDNTMKNFVKSLKEHKRAEVYSYFTEKEKNIAKSNKLAEIYGIENKKDDNEKNLFDQESKTDEKENYEQSKNVWRTSNPFLKRHKIESDPFRYNPNYNSIYKNIPSVKMGKPIFDTAFNTINANSIHTSKHDAFLTEINLSKNKKKSFKENSPTTTETNISKMDNRNKSFTDRSNHSLRFSRYVERKIFGNEISPKVSYIEPVDYLKTRKKTVDYEKMMSRGKNCLVYKSSLRVPSFYHYDPKYEYFEDRPRNIILGKDNINDVIKKNRKKFLLRKLWGSFNVSVDYKLVDNAKLNNNALNEINF